MSSAAPVAGKHECRCGDVDAGDAQGASPRSSPYPMREMSDALQLVLAATRTLANEPQGQKHAYLPLAQAVGHVLAQDRHATTPVPAYAASIMVCETKCALADTAFLTTRLCSLAWLLSSLC
jgi:hypothetical protein